MGQEVGEQPRAREMSVLLEARQIVRAQPMTLAVGHLKHCADQLHEAYDVLKVSCTRTASAQFVAAFSRTLLAIERVHAQVPPSPSGGRMKLDTAKETTQVSA